MKNTQFYSEGLRFSCKRCSACCRLDPGFVYLSENDLDKLVLETKMDKANFIKKYCRWCADDSLSLLEKPNNDCIFWDSGCTVYKNRPLQCRTYPFWKNILVSEENWEAAGQDCPGINNGKLNTQAEINEYLRLRSAQPIIYRSNK